MAIEGAPPRDMYVELSTCFVSSLKEIRYLRSVIQMYQSSIPEFSAIDLTTFNDSPEYYKHLLPEKATPHREVITSSVDATQTNELMTSEDTCVSRDSTVEPPAVDAAVVLKQPHEDVRYTTQRDALLYELSIIESMLVMKNMEGHLMCRDVNKLKDEEVKRDLTIDKKLWNHNSLTMKLQDESSTDLSRRITLLQVQQKLKMLKISIDLLKTDFLFKLHEVASFSVEIIALLRSSNEINVEEFRVLKDRLLKISNLAKEN